MENYILLKEMPFCKAGAVFTPDPHVDWYNNDEWQNSLPKKYVENNPEWFCPESQYCKQFKKPIRELTEFEKNVVKMSKYYCGCDCVEDKTTKEYSTYLKDCDCKSEGIIVKEGIAVCRWCRKPYAKGGMMQYKDEHFKQIIDKNIEYEVVEREKDTVTLENSTRTFGSPINLHELRPKKH